MTVLVQMITGFVLLAIGILAMAALAGTAVSVFRLTGGF